MTTNYFDGRISKVGFFKPSDISAQASSIISTTYNGGITTQYGKLTAAFKTDSGLSNWYDLNEYDGNAIDAHGTSDWTDNNTVTSAIGPGTDKIADESSNANHGTITGFTNTGDIVSTDVPSALAGSLDYSMKGDGADDEVEIGTDFPLYLKDDSWSVSAWIKHDGGGDYRGIVGRWYFGVSAGWVFQVTPDDSLLFHLTNAGGTNYFGAFGSTTLTQGQWYHVTVTYDGSVAWTGINLYVDAVAETEAEFGLGSKDPGTLVASSLKVLSRGGDSPFQGNICDARIYDYELTADNVTYIYTNGTSGTAPATVPVGQWGGSNDSFPVGAVVDGQPVIRATDRATNSVDAIQTTLSKRPVYTSNVANGKGGLLFDATDDGMTLISNITSTNWTAFVVVKLASNVDGTGTYKGILFDETATVHAGMENLLSGIAGETVTIAGSTATIGEAASTTTVSSGTRLLTYQGDGTTPKIWVDRVAQSLTIGTAGNFDVDVGGIGWRPDGAAGQPFNDHILAILIYDSALSDDKIASVESYLSDQYGLGL